MLGGGTFVTQNKVLPGSYINFISAANLTSDIGERGYACVALKLKWGKDGEIFTVTADDFRKKCLEIFGFEYDSEDAKGLRDLFRNAKTVYCYKIMNGGAKATNSVATAKYKGSVGTKLSTEILAGVISGTFDVNIYYENSIVYSQNVASIEELNSKANEWVDWNISALSASPKTALSGSNLDGSTPIATQYSAFLDASEAYTFNAMICNVDNDSFKELYVQEVKDMRDNCGVKYQLVLHNKACDYEGVVNVKNSIDSVYWVGGAIAGCAVNASNTNKVYDGEFDIPTPYSKAELENSIKNGEFVFHKVGEEVRVLEDINSFVSITDEKKDDFKFNQTIRVIDQIAMDIAQIFNDKYLGKIPNDESGRISLWNDIVKHHQNLDAIRAIENFNASDVTIEKGESKRSVVVNDVVTIVNSMTQLYMSVVVQ